MRTIRRGHALRLPRRLTALGLCLMLVSLSPAWGGALPCCQTSGSHDCCCSEEAAEAETPSPDGDCCSQTQQEEPLSGGSACSELMMQMGMVSLDSPDCSCVKFVNASGTAGTIPTNPDGSGQVSPLSPTVIHSQDDPGPTHGETSFGLDRSIDHNRKTHIYTLLSSFLC